MPERFPETVMPSFASLHTGQFIIKRRRIQRVRLWRMALCIGALGAVYVVFELGRYSAGYSVTSALQSQWSQRQRMDSLTGDMQRLQRDLDSAQMTVQMDQKASAALQDTLAEAQANIQKQNEELAFYRGIVAPQMNAATQPAIQRLEILPGPDARHFQIRLVLIQSAQITTQAQGVVAVAVTGQQQGHTVQLSLKELAPALASDTLKFSYRYFQSLQQDVELPADFEPASVQVEMRANSRPVQQQQFAWQPGAVQQASSQVTS